MSNVLEAHPNRPPRSGAHAAITAPGIHNRTASFARSAGDTTGCIWGTGGTTGGGCGADGPPSTIFLYFCWGHDLIIGSYVLLLFALFFFYVFLLRN